MEIIKIGKSAPEIKNITYYNNVEREDGSNGCYLVINFFGGYKTKIINVDTKINVNNLNKDIKIIENKKSDRITLYDTEEQGGIINER